MKNGSHNANIMSKDSFEKIQMIRNGQNRQKALILVVLQTMEMSAAQLK